jgi:hypothetical protein
MVRGKPNAATAFTGSAFAAASSTHAGSVSLMWKENQEVQHELLRPGID